MGWFKKFMGNVSDWIPNEISKTNSITKYIPVVGQFTQGISAADRFAETYSNTGSWIPSLKHGATGFMGTAADPYAYSPKNKAGFTNDWWLNAGKLGNIGGAVYGGDYLSAAQQGIGFLGMNSQRQQMAPMQYRRSSQQPIYYQSRSNGFVPVQTPNIMFAPTNPEFGVALDAPWRGFRPRFA
jgi:hypothetical protein